MIDIEYRRRVWWMGWVAVFLNVIVLPLIMPLWTGIWFLSVGNVVIGLILAGVLWTIREPLLRRETE